MFDLTGKTALVTGATGGIGGAIARALHAQGATVVLSGTRAEALEALKGELGARAVIAPCNLSDPASVEALVKAAEAAAAKAGLAGMSRSLAQEVASRNITVNCVAPGFIATAMTDKLNDEQKSGLMTRIPAGRMGTPEDIAAAVVYLASDEAAYVTGETLQINGGMVMI